MREATCAGTQTSKAPTLSGPSVTNHYSVLKSQDNSTQALTPELNAFLTSVFLSDTY